MTKQEDLCGTDHEGMQQNSADDTFQVYWSGPIDFKSVKRIKDVTRTEGNIMWYELVGELGNLQEVIFFKVIVVKYFAEIRTIFFQ